jgi:hypothetical protein
MIASPEPDKSCAPEAANAEPSAEYVERLKKDLTRMREMLDRLPDEPIDRRNQIDGLYALIHNVRGPAQRAGHEIATRICTLACGILQRHREPDDHILRAVRAHIEALGIIVAHDLPDDGDSLSQQMVTQLESLAAAARG